MDNNRVIKGVENPKLLSAIEKHLDDNSDETYNELVIQLRKGKYLAVMMNDNMKVVDGIVQQGSTLSLGLIEDDEGKMLLPLFTDWVHLAQSAPGKGGFVMDADWAFSMGKEQFDGVVINHTGMALPIYQKALSNLLNAKQEH